LSSMKLRKFLSNLFFTVPARSELDKIQIFFRLLVALRIFKTTIDVHICHKS
jgi:hypothetical protein